MNLDLGLGIFSTYLVKRPKPVRNDDGRKELMISILRMINAYPQDYSIYFLICANVSMLMKQLHEDYPNAKISYKSRTSDWDSIIGTTTLLVSSLTHSSMASGSIGIPEDSLEQTKHCIENLLTYY